MNTLAIIWVLGFAIHLATLYALRWAKIREDGSDGPPEIWIVLALVGICALWPIGWLLVLVAAFFVDRWTER